MTRRRQPLVTGRWGSLYRSWFWTPDASSKNKRLGKRRSAKRERVQGNQEAQQRDGSSEGPGRD